MWATLSRKENILFFISSMILSYLIAQYHFKTMNRSFILTFVVLTIFFYFFFSFIATDEFPMYQEKFTNGIDDYDTFLNNEVSGYSESSGHEEISGQEPEPTPTPQPTPTPTPAPSTEMSGHCDNKPDMNNIIFDKPTTGNAYGPLNINISYKNQECGNGDGKKPCNPLDPYVKDVDDMGRYNYKSRVHNNMDWMRTWNHDNYGSQAWTLDPDYYIPEKERNRNPEMLGPPVHERPHFQNELNYRYNQSNEKCTVCPVEVNKSYSEFKTGDKEPEPFNL
jgi:hypothetical protein